MAAASICFGRIPCLLQHDLQGRLHRPWTVPHEAVFRDGLTPVAAQRQGLPTAVTCNPAGEYLSSLLLVLQRRIPLSAFLLLTRIAVIAVRGKIGG